MSKLHGVIYTLLASIAFGIMPIWVKIAYTTGLTAYDVLFFRALIAAVFLFVFIKMQKINLSLTKKQIGILLFGSIIGYAAALLTLYLSYQYISVGVATALHYLFPVVVTIFAFLFYREKLHRNKLLALFISIAGIYVMTAFGKIKFNPLGILLALLSAVTFAIYVVTIANKEIKKINSYVLAFYVCVISTVISGTLIIAQGQWPPNITGKGLFYCTLVAVFCTSLALIFFIRGVKIIGPATTSILSTLEPLVSLVAGVMILGELLTLQIIIGSMLVIGAILLIAITDAGKEKIGEYE